MYLIDQGPGVFRKCLHLYHVVKKAFDFSQSLAFISNALAMDGLNNTCKQRMVVV